MSGPSSNSISGFETREISQGRSLHIRREDRRKTSRLRLSWVTDLGPGAALNCLVPSCLLRGTVSHPTLRDISRRSEELWGLGVGTSIDRCGQRQILSIQAEFPEDSRLPGEEKVLADAVEFFRELIHQPHLVAGKFPEETVETEIAQHRRSIEGRLDNKRSWALQRCVEETCPDEPWRFHEYGSVEELAGATSETITGLWHDAIDSCHQFVHFSGDVDRSVVEPILMPLFGEESGPAKALSERFPLRGSAQMRQMEERFQGQQANLVISLRTNTGHEDPLHEAMLITNGILGGFPHSRLFSQVREKQSLCNSIGSHVEGSNGLMCISAGIDGDSTERARDSILEQIEVMKRGEFSAEELQMTLNAWESRLRMIQDSPASLAEFDLISRLVDRQPSVEALREKVATVTRDEVVEAANRLQPDLVYLLTPEEN